MNQKNPWSTIEKRVVFRDEWISVRQDKVTKPDGALGTYTVVELSPAVGVIALSDAGKVYLVGQWRYCLERFSWEVPTGMSEVGERALRTAERELFEETGITAKVWIDLGSIDNSNAVTTEVSRLFLARQLSQVEPVSNPNEPLVGKWIEFADAVRMVRASEITDATSVAGLLKAWMYIADHR